MRIQVASERPRAQIIMAIAMIALSIVFIRGNTDWFAFTLFGFAFGLIGGILWWVSFYKAPSTIFELKSVKEFQHAFGSTKVGYIHRIFGFLTVAVVVLLSILLSESNKLSCVVVGNGVAAATGALIHVIAVVIYERRAA